MVRTRKMGSVDDDLSSHEYGKQRGTSNSAKKEDECEESDESDFMPVVKRRKVCRTNSACSKTSERSKSRTNFVGIEKSLKNGTHRNQGLVEDDDDSIEAKDRAAEQSNGYCSGIRRSTRQRKSTYNTLNQGWLLGSGRPRDFTGLVDDVSVGERLRKDGSDHQKMKKDEDDDSNSQGVDFEDMYTRVKRERRNASRRVFNQEGKKSKRRGRPSRGHEDDEDDESSKETSEEDTDEEEEGDEEIAHHLAVISEEETHDDDSHNTKYYLRQKKPIIDRFQMPIPPQKRTKQLHLAPGRRRPHCKDYRSTFLLSPAHRSPRFSSRRHATHNSSTLSSSSSSSDEDDERRFERRKSKSMARARNRCLPMNLNQEEVAANDVFRDRTKVGSSLADVDPMAIDRAVTFESVGGHNHHVHSLKEMLLLPLMYPEVFEKFKITPPRGVLFYGPPGTGKTLVARALANECSQGERRVAFFMRKGADCLSKWVGESERQLRLLFDQAYSMRPSIIFFDEIDGLAPVRSTRQDQIHSSIVSTLLALMDGLDSRGEVVVIGATNRIDAIDSALRRPGRFDREFNFPLPSFEARLSILKIHTKDWNPPLEEMFLEELAEKTVGYCGADIKALCAEATFLALRRRYPQIYLSRQKLQLDISSIKIVAKDFYKAISKIVPVAQRSATAPGRPLSPFVRPLLLTTLNHVLEALKSTFPQGFTKKRSTSNDDCPKNGPDFGDVSSDEGSVIDDHHNDVVPLHALHLNGIVPSISGAPSTSVGRNLQSSFNHRREHLRYVSSHRPRLLLAGHKGQGQSIHVAPAVLHHLERFPTQKLDLPALYAVSAKSPEESCAQIFLEAQRNLPSILYLPHVGQWWDTLSDTVRATFLTLLNDLEPTTPLLLLATSDCHFNSLPSEVRELFNPHQGEVINMSNPTKAERRQFFSDLILYEAKRPPRSKRKRSRKVENLPLAPPPAPRTLSEGEVKKLREHEENTMRELRLFLREILDKLIRDRRFTFFTKPVDTQEVTDYLQVIKEPMDLETMMTKIDLHKYETVSGFLDDITLISQNALEYNPDREPSDKVIRHRACALRDVAHCLVQTELDPEFEQICHEIKEARKNRGDSPSKYAPKQYHMIPRLPSLKLDKVDEEMQSAELSASSADHQFPRNTLSRQSVDSDYPKRYSRRIRGLDSGSQERSKQHDDQSPKSPAMTSESCKELVKTRKVPTLRRRPGLWFGQRRRVVRPAILESYSEDSSEMKEPKVAAVERRQPQLNGGVDDDISWKGSACFLSTPPCSPSPVIRKGTLVNDESSMDSVEIPLCPLAAACVSIIGLEGEGLSNSSKDVLQVVKNTIDEAVNNIESCRSPDTVKSSLNNNTLCLSEPSVCDVHEKVKTPDVDTNLPKLKDQTNTNSTNEGLVNGHVEMEEEVEEEEEEEEVIETRTVIVDQTRLCRLLDAIVVKTEGVVVERLEKLHCKLHQLVRSNQIIWDKTVLLTDLEKEIERFD